MSWEERDKELEERDLTEYDPFGDKGTGGTFVLLIVCVIILALLLLSQ